MTSFFVGQRVRLVRATEARNNGIEGRFAGFQFTPAGSPAVTDRGEIVETPIDCDCLVHYDKDTRAALEHTSRIEPILPEGAQPSEYTFSELMDRCRAGEGVCA